MKFTIIYGSSNGASISIEEADSVEDLKKQILDDNDGVANFIEDVEANDNTEYWPESSYLILKGKPL